MRDASIPEPKHLTTSRACRRHGWSRWFLYRRWHDGLIQPAGKLGKSLTWSVADLDRVAAGEPLSALISSTPAPTKRATPANDEDVTARIERTQRGGSR